MAERYRRLDLLHPDFRPMAERFLAKCVGAGIMVMVVETWRSQEAHEEDVKNGRSWVAKSKHQNIEKGDAVNVLEKGGILYPVVSPASLAIDVAPYEQYQLYGADKLQWDGAEPVWQKLGKIGESVGLKWGGRWKRRRDFAHFEAPWV